MVNHYEINQCKALYCLMSPEGLLEKNLKFEVQLNHKAVESCQECEFKLGLSEWTGTDVQLSNLQTDFDIDLIMS